MTKQFMINPNNSIKILVLLKKKEKLKNDNNRETSYYYFDTHTYPIFNSFVFM